MNLRGSGRVRVFRHGRYVLVSRKQAQELEFLANEAFIAAEHPLKDMGFFCLSVPNDDDPFVSITGGNLRIVIYPFLMADVDSVNPAQGFNRNGRLLDMFYHGFTPNTEGYLVFKYTHGTGSQANTPITAPVVDFGAPVDLYAVTITPGVTETIEGGNTVEYPEGEFTRFAVVFVEDIPVSSSEFFYCPICKVTVNDDGFPHVDQIHIGDIKVPKGFDAAIVGFTVNVND